MTWTKLSDDFTDECWTLSNPGFRLLVEMLNYSNKKLYNCVIPKDEFRRFAKHPEALPELVDGGWVVDLGEGVEILFHASYQREREMQLAMQARNVANGKKGGRPRKPSFMPDNPDGNPDGNPEGRVGSGQDSSIREAVTTTKSEVVNTATGEVTSELSWAVTAIPGSVSEHEIESFHIDSISAAS